MKFIKLFAFLAIMGFCFTETSCKKKETECACQDTPPNTSINYPNDMFYGKNVLTIQDSVYKDSVYSFGANLGEDATLKIVITNLSVQTNTDYPKSVWAFGSPQGWTINNYTNDTQTFLANKSGDVICLMYFNKYEPHNPHGKCQIDYYENSSSITKTQVLNW